LQVIIPIVEIAIGTAAVDMSPYVRKCAAHAIPKLCDLSPESSEKLLETLEKLLHDRTSLVLGSVVMAFDEICPTRYDLIHKHFRKLCNTLPDIDEWGQVAVLQMLTRCVLSLLAVLRGGLVCFMPMQGGLVCARSWCSFPFGAAAADAAMGAAWVNAKLQTLRAVEEPNSLSSRCTQEVLTFVHCRRLFTFTRTTLPQVRSGKLPRSKLRSRRRQGCGRNCRELLRRRERRWRLVVVRRR
jgi:hypothetical protein